MDSCTANYQHDQLETLETVTPINVLCRSETVDQLKQTGFEYLEKVSELFSPWLLPCLNVQIVSGTKVIVAQQRALCQR